VVAIDDAGEAVDATRELADLGEGAREDHPGLEIDADLPATMVVDAPGRRPGALARPMGRRRRRRGDHRRR